MYNTAHPETSLNTVEYETVFDFLNPSTVTPSYRYWPSYPDFTFKVEFTGGDDTVLSDVYVVTTDSAGEETYIPCSYDSSTGLWIGTHKFTSQTVPDKLRVEYENIAEEEIIILQDELDDIIESFNGYIDNYAGLILNECNVNFYRKDIVSDKDYTVQAKVAPKDNDNNDSYVNITFTAEEIENFEADESYYEVITDDGEKYYYCREQDDYSVTTTTYYASDKVYRTIKINTPPDSSFTLEELLNLFVNNLPDWIVKNLPDWLSDYLDELLPDITATSLVNRVQNIYNQIMENLENNSCLTDMERENIKNNVERNCREIYDILEHNPNNTNHNSGETFLDTLSGAVSELVDDVPYSKAVKKTISVGTYLGLRANLFDLNNQFKRSAGKGILGGQSMAEEYGASSDPNCNSGLTGEVLSTLDFADTVILDPSGYVYEAVPSNRVEGVKAEVYYYDYELDEFGMPAEEKTDILWDAENYDQVNPLYTDANGEYAWDVPVGQWLVKFSKDGYYDTDSKSVSDADEDGYLPVPPPQTEVNVGIVSKNAPTVKDVSIYENQIRIEFSQYVKPSTVNTSNVIIQVDGNQVNGSITPLNAEYDLSQVNQYASIFAFTPETNLTGDVSIKINNVVNYAGKSMESAFNKTSCAEIKPESINANDNLTVAYNSGALLAVSVLPANVGSGHELTVTSSSPSIVGIANSTVTTDENGCANIMVTGNLPGQAEITISLSGTDLSKTVNVTVEGVVSVQDRCDKVKANIVSGTTVEKGTCLELSTTTEGAEIYYTLDGTCPCVVDSSSRIKYTSPIEITDDMFIIAYAVKEGMTESYTAGFTYFVSSQSCEHANIEIRNAVEVTCTTDGYSGDVYCADCDELLETGTTIVATGHTYGAWKTTKTATCKAAGTREKVCTACGNKVIENVAKLTTHTPTKAVKENVVKATYTIGGSYDSVVYCSVCGKELSRTKVLTDKLESVETTTKKAETTTAKAVETTTAKAVETTTKKAETTTAKTVETTTEKVVETTTEVVKSEFTYGDINHDGKIRANDARLVLRDSAELDVYAGKILTEIASGVFQTEDGKLYDRTLADINHDGKIRANDARKILRASAELEDPTTW